METVKEADSHHRLVTSKERWMIRRVSAHYPGCARPAHRDDGEHSYQVRALLSHIRAS